MRRRQSPTDVSGGGERETQVSVSHFVAGLGTIKPKMRMSADHLKEKTVGPMHHT